MGRSTSISPVAALPLRTCSLYGVVALTTVIRPEAGFGLTLFCLPFVEGISFTAQISLPAFIFWLSVASIEPIIGFIFGLL